MTEGESKCFATLAAEYALLGHALIRAAATDGNAPFYATRWGWLKPLQSLEEARLLLQQLRGRASR